MRLLTYVLLFLCIATGVWAETTSTYSGHVLPFKIITAIRNYGFREGMRPAQVAISVQGGTQADWLATAAFVAEKSIVSDVTFSTVEVYFPSPWGDLPPTGTKMLAKAYYSGPDPQKSPWPDDQWLVIAQGHAPTLADIEYDELSGKLLEEAPEGEDPEKASDAADARALRLVIRKYHLARTWKPDEHLGAADSQAVTVKRKQINISDSDVGASLEALSDCLARSEPSGLFRGCRDNSEEYRFNP